MSGDHLTVSPRTVAALQAAHDRGVCLAIATGRTLDFIDHVAIFCFTVRQIFIDTLKAAGRNGYATRTDELK